MNARFLGLALAALTTGTATAQWAVLTPPASPPARGSAVMACDFLANKLVLFGGVGGTGLTNYSDTWTYDGTTWTQQSPATSPPFRFSSDLVFDSNRQVFVMYGGNASYSTAGTNQTWEYDGVTWTQRFPANNPGNLGLHAMAYDSVRSKVVLYGGMPGGNPIVDSNQTWEYDSVNWVRRFPATNPGPLEAHSMCFHLGVGKTILFGGVNANPNTPISLIDSDRTWAFDGTNWAELPVPGTRPPKRERARIAYDMVRNVCVLVGGMHYSNGQVRTDTWELSENAGTWTWTQVVTPGLPTTFFRHGSTLAFMLADRQMVQFGGLRGTATFSGETGEYGAKLATFGSGCAGTNGVPALAANDAPRIGSSWSLNVTNLNPTLNFAVMVLGFTRLQPPVDLGPLYGMTGCTDYVSTDFFLSAPAGAGGSTTWTWNPVNGPIGIQLHAQALCLDPGANSFGLTISNAVSGTLGV